MEQFVLQAQKIKLAINADKIEDEIAQSLDYTCDFTRKKIKIAKFLRDAKAQVKEEECELTQQKWANERSECQITEDCLQELCWKPSSGFHFRAVFELLCMKTLT